MSAAVALERDLKLSQNPRMVEVGRPLWTASGPTPLLKQGHLEMVVWDHGQTAFGSPRRETPTCLDEPVSMLSDPHFGKSIS